MWPREAGGIEQRHDVAVAREPLAQRREALAVGGERDRERLVVGERAGDQLGQPDGVQQAAGDAARECRRPGRSAPARRPRARRPRSRGRCNRACRERGRRGACRARWSSFDGTRGAKTSRRRRRRDAPPPAADCDRGSRWPRQPQHAALDRAEQAHPDVEHVGRDLEAVVEAAEDEVRVCGQARFRTRRRAARDAAAVSR